MNTETSSETFDPRAAATAWALGELTPEERAAFEQKAGNDAGLAALAEETKEFCGLLAGSLGHPTIELQQAARSRLLLEADRPRRDAKVVRGKWIRRLTTMAACVAAGGAGMQWWMMSGSNRRAYESPQLAASPVSGKDSIHTMSDGSARQPTLVSAPGIDRARPNLAATSGIDASSTVTDDAMQKQIAAVEQSRTAMTEVMRKNNIVDQAPLSTTGTSNATPATDPARQKEYAATKSDYENQLQQLSKMREHTMQIDTAAPADVAQNSDSLTPSAGETPPAPTTRYPQAESTMSVGGIALSGPQGAGGAGVGRGAGAGVERRERGISVPAGDDPPQIPQTFGGGGKLFSDGAPATPAKAAAKSLAKSASTSPVAEVAGDGYGPGSAPGAGRDGDAARSKYLYADSANLEEKPVDMKLRTGPGGEEYDQVVENPFRSVMKEPLSTFSTDVDTASYSNVRRFLNMGQCPPPAAVRLEELVNYFPYDYAPPQDGKPFAVHVEMTSAPWDGTHRLARIALKGKEIAQGERPAANLVFLVDVSGSMNEENKLPLVKKSLKFVVERLTDKDTVSIVTYAGDCGVALPATSGRDRERIAAAIDELSTGGGTNGAGGITMAYAQAAKHFNKEGINRVILATDGDFNVGITSHDDLLKLITQKAKSGTFLSVLGYGMGNTKDNRMELLADKGNGNYAYIDSLSEARKTLADQFSGTLVTIAKDVKVQIEFNPAVVRSYRLLGYENRMLAKEDFNNDKKDAGEIGAGHTVTALYELIPAGVPEQPANITDKLKYQPKTEPVAAPPPAAVDASGETMTVKLRWKAPDGDQSQLMEVPVNDRGAKIAEASPETRWAVAVAGFASLLNNSRHAGLSWEDVRTLARGSKGADPNGYRGEFLQLVDKAESVRGK